MAGGRYIPGASNPIFGDERGSLRPVPAMELGRAFGSTLT